MAFVRRPVGVPAALGVLPDVQAGIGRAPMAFLAGQHRQMMLGERPSGIELAEQPGGRVARFHAPTVRVSATMSPSASRSALRTAALTGSR